MKSFIKNPPIKKPGVNKRFAKIKEMAEKE